VAFLQPSVAVVPPRGRARSTRSTAFVIALKVLKVRSAYGRRHLQRGGVDPHRVLPRELQSCHLTREL
jgi:hypothetical protein